MSDPQFTTRAELVEWARKVRFAAWWAQDYEGGPGYWSTPPSLTGRGYTILPDYPTHWQPLPAPPTEGMK